MGTGAFGSMAPWAASGDWVALGRGLRLEAEALRPRVPVVVARPGRAAREVPFARPGRGARAPEAPGAAMEVVRVLAGTTRFSEAGNLLVFERDMRNRGRTYQTLLGFEH